MPYIVGHRGAPKYLPENTLESFEKAIEFGVDFIECDVHLSKDGRVVVIHDGRVNRTTDGTGFVKDLTLNELKQLSAGPSGRIPTIEEVLDLNFPVLIELKTYLVSGEFLIYPDLATRLLKVLKESSLSQDIYLISFERYYLEQLRDSGFKKGFLAADFPELDSLSDLDVSDIGIEHHALNAANVEEAHRRSLHVTGWTADTREDILRLAEIGVDFITSNDPPLAIETVRR